MATPPLKALTVKATHNIFSLCLSPMRFLGTWQENRKGQPHFSVTCTFVVVVVVTFFVVVVVCLGVVVVVTFFVVVVVVTFLVVVVVTGTVTVVPALCVVVVVVYISGVGSSESCFTTTSK